MEGSFLIEMVSNIVCFTHLSSISTLPIGPVNICLTSNYFYFSLAPLIKAITYFLKFRYAKFCFKYVIKE